MYRPEDIAPVSLAQLLQPLNNRSGKLYGVTVGGLAILGWLWYLAFVSGKVPGIHWVGVAYSTAVFWAEMILILALGPTLPIVAIAIVILLLASLKSSWRQTARRGVKTLLVLSLATGLLILSMLPAVIVSYAPKSHHRVADWHSTFRTIYAAFPLDDNYGDLLLLKCGRLGLCHQIYRFPSNISSVEETTFQYDPDTDQLGLYLDSTWAYVRSRTTELCRLHRDWQTTLGPLCPFPVSKQS